MARQDLILELDPKDTYMLEQLVNRVKESLQTMDPFFDAVEMHMIDSLTQNFEQEGRPQAWEPLSPVTIELKGSDRALQDVGTLRQSINSANTSRGKLNLKIWAGDSKAAFHQFVDQDPEDQFSMTNAKGMPMRPFILFQDEDLDEIEEILGRYIDSVMK